MKNPVGALLKYVKKLLAKEVFQLADSWPVKERIFTIRDIENVYGGSRQAFMNADFKKQDARIQ